MSVAQDVKQMEQNIKQYPEPEVTRLQTRAAKFYDYCVDKGKGKKSSKVLSLSLMILIERAKAVEEFKQSHKCSDHEQVGSLHGDL